MLRPSLSEAKTFAVSIQQNLLHFNEWSHTLMVARPKIVQAQTSLARKRICLRQQASKE